MTPDWQGNGALLQSVMKLITWRRQTHLCFVPEGRLPNVSITGTKCDACSNEKASWMESLDQVFGDEELFEFLSKAMNKVWEGKLPLGVKIPIQKLYWKSDQMASSRCKNTNPKITRNLNKRQLLHWCKTTKQTVMLVPKSRQAEWKLPIECPKTEEGLNFHLKQQTNLGLKNC